MNLNKVQLIGRITRKPELKNGNVCSFSMATNNQYVNNDGKKIEESEFHNIVAFGKLGETIVNYMTIGSEIYVEGRIKTSSWQKDDGSKAYRTDIVAEKVQFGQKPQGAKQSNTKERVDENMEAIANGLC